MGNVMKTDAIYSTGESNLLFNVLYIPNNKTMLIMEINMVSKGNLFKGNIVVNNKPINPWM